MQKKSIRKGILGLVLSLASVTAFSATIEGFWHSIDDKTGEKLSIIEIRKDAKNEYNGTIVYRYPVPGAKALYQMYWRIKEQTDSWYATFNWF